MSTAHVNRLLDRLDCTSWDGEERRAHVRVPYRRDGVAMRVVHRMSDQSKVLVQTRNLSCGGICVLHRGFIHEKSRCVISLPRKEGEPTLVTGTVVSCRYLVKLIHEVGVRFDEKIEIEDFLDLPVGFSESKRPEVAESVEEAPTAPEKDLSGRVLCMSNEANRLGEAVGRMREEGLDVQDAPFLGAGADFLKQRRFDFVVCDAGMEGLGSRDVIRTIRRAGHAGLVILVGDARDGLDASERTRTAVVGLDNSTTSVLGIISHELRQRSRKQ